MTALLTHRGPDEGGVQVDGPVAFGHRRLSVIDLSSAGRQPMWDHDQQFLITFNGEIYNFRELRDELSAGGASFRTRTDTEVIIEAYKAWGTDAFARLNGMFAFALWDRAKRRVLLVRDRVGEKPLYWRSTKTGILFGSELKVLRIDHSLPDEIDPGAMRSFLTLGYVIGEQSIISGVRRLPPASFLILDPEQEPRIVGYWDLASVVNAGTAKMSLAVAADRLKHLLDDAVRLRLCSDVPLGAFLSGGIDSAAIVAAMRAIEPSSHPTTFSIGFQEAEFDELLEARASALALGTHHLDERVTAASIDRLPQMLSVADEPFADTSLMPTWQLCQFARKATTVALSGDGGDELFGGYVTYRANALQRKLSATPTWAFSLARSVMSIFPVNHGKVSLQYKISRFLDFAGLPFERAHYSWRRILDDHHIVALAGSRVANATDPFSWFEKAFSEVPNADPLARASYVDIKTWLADDILVKVDRSSMAHGLEVRSPFLDHRLVEFALTLPSELKLRGKLQKRVLKSSQLDRLPKAILQRPKAGFNSPVSQWFEGALAGHFERTIIEGRGSQFIDRVEAMKLRDEHRRRTRDHGMALFALTVFGLWLESGRPAVQGRQSCAETLGSETCG